MVINKRRIILGIFVVMVMAICGAFLNTTRPSVFASETPEQTFESITIDAGTFYGQGYYVVGEKATLIAVMNDGYAFDAWASVDDNDGTETILSTELEYTFVVAGNINIEYRYHKIEYSVDFEQDLYLNETELKDFTYQVTNKSDEYEEYYYNTPTEIVVTIKNDLYINKIDEEGKDITINGVSLYNVIRTNNNPMGVTYTINNDEKTGFTSFVINLNIREDITIGIDYVYMYELEILSGNSIPISDIIHLIKLQEDTYYSKPYDDKYIYLVSADKPVVITMLKDETNVYQSPISQFQGKDPSLDHSQECLLSGNSTFTVTYSKMDYAIEFNSYLINLYGEKDLMQTPFYDIANVGLTAGDTIGFAYDEDTKNITITDVAGNDIVYQYPTIYGYRFVGFAILGQTITDTTYTLSATDPVNATKEIQLIFEFIEYSFEIKLVDNYFTSDETLSYGYKFDNDFDKLVTGTEITLQASSSKYTINGWSLSSAPKVDGYIEDVTPYTFEPTSDTDTSFVIYLDVDYNYLTTTYNLKQSSIVQNMTYDVVKLDWDNNTIIFSDSENANSYISESIVANGDNSVITTQNFGTVTISSGVLSYTINQITLHSVSMENADNIDTYIFKKYTYFGDLQIGLVEYITLSENGDDTTVVLGGTIYSDSAQTSGAIQTFTTTKTYDDAMGAYLLDDQYRYSMYLYMNEDVYDYIVLRDVKYYFDGTNFVLDNATINTPDAVESQVTKGSTYTIQLNNLLPNAVLVYQTKSTDSTNYRFSTFTNKKGSTLWPFENNGYNTCILNINSTDVVNVDYKQLANNINLVINNESAYLSNITFTIQATDGAVTSGEGNVISAQDNEIITIMIVQDNITKGYKFDNYIFDGEIVTDSGNPLVLSFAMDSRVYANQIITIEFSAIQYTININYIDKQGNIITSNEAKGEVRLQGQTTALETLTVDVNGEYSLEAVANAGYYVSNAYIGTSFTLGGLIGTNSNENLITTWNLNSENFEQAIVDNAGESNEINLYINFAIHTYSVKVYFEISSNASAITYPTLYINGVEQKLIIEAEVENGVSSTKRFVLAKGFEYQTNVLFNVEEYMLGTTILQWTNSKGQQIATTSQYTLSQITQDTTLKVVLQYVRYVLEFVSVDEAGEKCTYGSASTSNNTIKLYDTVQYMVNTELGYVLKGKYYYNREGEIGSENIDSGFVFNPSNFKEESTIKIYLVFTLKVVNLNISNSVDGSMYYYDGQQASDLATFTVSRQRGNTIETLSAETGYQFQTGDILTIQINPISIGIELNKIQLGTINITNASTAPYKWGTEDVKENDTLTGMYYTIQITFTAGVINGLTDEVALINVLKVKTFNITYTYNYIDYKFGIRLIRQYNGSTATGNKDVAMLVPNVGYGSEIMFSYAYEGMNSGDGAKFNVDGFSVAGIKQNVSDRFRFNDITLWEQVALAKYSEGSSEIAVVLVLKPKITLNNYTSYSETLGYTYERSYVGESQGLVTTGSKLDVVIGGDFATVIQYSYDAGANFLDEQPMNVGEYPVKIIAKIGSNDAQTTDVVFEEKVTYIITPATLSISLKSFNSNNPITKTYDGTNNLSSRVIVDDIVFNGLYQVDVGNVFVDISRLRAQFADVLVNSSSNLYDINVFDIYLLDASNNTIQNYKMLSGQNLVFTRIGKINPKELTITGFIASNKVYDGTSSVSANVEGINYVGKLETDSTEVLTNNLRFYLEDYSIGAHREVFIDWSNALVGADSTNYSITYDKTYIDIHPYEITYELKGYGTFKIVDVDRLCLIPIGSKIVAKVFERGSDSYSTIYSTIESEVSRGEKLKYVYEIILQVGAVNLQVPENLYIYIPKINKINDIYQVPSEQQFVSLEYLTENEYTIVKVTRGKALIGVVVRTTYMPLWLIILIVVLALALVGVIVLVIIIIRRKAKKKYSRYDKI